MEYKKLGRTELSVSQIALGCSGFEKKDREHIRRLIHYAADHGVNFLDLFVSEPELRSYAGEAIAGKRDKFVIQGHIGSAWQNGQYLRTREAAMTQTAFEDQLKRLGTDYIDVGMIHYVDALDDWNTIVNGPFIDYVQKLKTTGQIRYIGLGSHNPDVAVAAVESGLIEVLMFSINPCYDMQPANEDVEKIWELTSYENSLHNQDTSRKRLYELCESQGVGIDVMKAYGGGDLLNAEWSPFGKAFTAVQCLHYALTRPAVAAVMVGAHSTEQIDAALAYLSASDAEKDYSGVLSGLDRFTFSGHCLYCGHCAPCPAGIDVAAVTKYLNLCLAQGTVPASERGHYELLSHHGGECTACGQCEKNCPFSVEIIKNMRKAANLFGF